MEKENARSLPRLKNDPRYEALHQEALTIVNATDRIPAPELIGHTVFNFWQDPTNVRGLWRRTTQQSYATATPAWETVLDLDKLSADENANWNWGGANCPPPRYQRCLVYLSDGGEDAKTIREFDLGTKSFVAGGFSLPKGKQDVDWLSDDQLILGRDWGPGTMTASGYPFVVKTLKRGQSLDRAVEVFRGKPDDVGVSPAVLHDGDGHQVVLIIRSTDTFHSETYQLTDKGVVRLDLPSKVSLQGLLHGNLIFSPQEDWTFKGEPYSAGSILAFSPEELAVSKPGEVVSNQVHLIFSPGPRQSVEQMAVTAHRVVAAIYDNVQGSLRFFRRPWVSSVGAAASCQPRPIRPSASTPPVRWTIRSTIRPKALSSQPISGRRMPAKAANALRRARQPPSRPQTKRRPSSKRCPPASMLRATKSNSSKPRPRMEPRFPISSCIRRA